MDEEKVVENAIAYFRSGFNCAESVLLAVMEAYGLSSELNPKVATPFGGGIGRRGSVCGALTGAVMTVGAKYGRTTPDNEAKEKPYHLALELYDRFQEQFGTVLCYDLTGCDLTTEEGRKRHVRTECERFVTGTIRILLSLTSSEAT